MLSLISCIVIAASLAKYVEITLYREKLTSLLAQLINSTGDSEWIWNILTLFLQISVTSKTFFYQSWRSFCTLCHVRFFFEKIDSLIWASCKMLFTSDLQRPRTKLKYKGFWRWYVINCKSVFWTLSIVYISIKLQRTASSSRGPNS
jgi:hypothetical protein